MAKIPWSRIREAFDGEWVELIDCSWTNNSPQPAAGRVRLHNSSRSELLKSVARVGRIEGSVILFIGPTLPMGSNLPEVQMHDGRYYFATN